MSRNISSGVLEITNETSLESVFRVEHVSERCFSVRLLESLENPRFLMQGVKRKTSGVTSTWKEQNGVATTNRGFGGFPTV